MSAPWETRRVNGTRNRRPESIGVLEFDAEELRNIAYALGLNDGGAQEMLELADHLDVLLPHRPQRAHPQGHCATVPGPLVRRHRQTRPRHFRRPHRRPGVGR